MSDEARKHDANYAAFVQRMQLATELLVALTECRTAKVERLVIAQNAETIIPAKAA